VRTFPFLFPELIHAHGFGGDTVVDGGLEFLDVGTLVSRV
jgi:hypothetical protein